MFTISKLFESNKIRIITYNDFTKNIYFSKIIKYDFSSPVKRRYYMHKSLLYISENSNSYEGNKSFNLKKEYLMYKYLIDKNNNIFENFNIYEEFKIKDTKKIELNFEYNNENICIEIDIDKLLDCDSDDHDDKENIDILSIMIADYDNTKVRFYDYFKRENTYNDIFNNINNILLKLNDLHKLNFIHGDFHISNILIDSNNNISFIDPEFSLVLNNNNITIIDEEFPLINLYLKLDNEYQITNDFLKIFDIYVFVIHIYRYRYNKLSFLENIYHYINSKSIIDKENYFLYFFVIYHQVFFYIKKFGNVQKIISNINLIASFKIIKKILLKKFDKVKMIDYETNNNFIYIYRIFEDLYELNK